MSNEKAASIGALFINKMKGTNETYIKGTIEITPDVIDFIKKNNGKLNVIGYFKNTSYNAETKTIEPMVHTSGPKKGQPLEYFRILKALPKDSEAENNSQVKPAFNKPTVKPDEELPY